MAVAQDNAFPVFHTVRSRSATPTKLLETKLSFPASLGQPRVEAEPLEGRPQTSGRIIGSGSMLQRVNNIAPGPFNIIGDGDKVLQMPGHRPGPSMTTSQDFIRPKSSGSVKSHTPRPSASSSVYTRIRSASTATRISEDDTDTLEVPVIPPIPREPGHFLQNHQGSSANAPTGPFDFGPLTQATRAETFPQGDRHPLRGQVQEPAERRPSEPSTYSHKPRASIAAAMQPLHEIGSVSSFKRSRSIKGRKGSQGGTQPFSKADGNLNNRNDGRLEDVPPLPASFRKAYHDDPSPFHTPRESMSSNGSYSSGARSGSSSSSPPLSESPPRREQGSAARARVNDMFEGFQFGLDNKPQTDKLTNHAITLPQETVEGYRADPIQPPPASARPTIPNIQPEELLPEQKNSPLVSADNYLVSSFDTGSNNLHLYPSPALSPPPLASPGLLPRRTQPPNKGPCRGCGESIKGKSVSSADGRLTGRYHKSCFVCKTCNSLFPTADFYVLNNHPYCARHYHELNGSLCRGCDRGIEGQYLETQSSHKFHSYCFTCQECHRLLRDDYYEWNGRRLCEQHAFRAAQQPSSSLGNGARRFPERRTTKLMMM
ncbi:MAG: hypothetical protein Q9163_001891 [Psora crenata]